MGDSAGVRRPVLVSDVGCATAGESDTGSSVRRLVVGAAVGGDLRGGLLLVAMGDSVGVRRLLLVSDAGCATALDSDTESSFRRLVVGAAVGGGFHRRVRRDAM